MKVKGVRGKLLVVDLSQQKTYPHVLSPEYYKKYLGGKALGGRLALENELYQVDPLSEENQLFLMVGPLTGTLAPGATKTIIVTRSPLTGFYLDSAVGGSLAYQIKMAGYDGIILKGKSKEQVYLDINNESVKFKTADDLWGLGCIETEKVLRGIYGSHVAVATIGPAGENMVKYACMTVDFHHQAGRGGVGALLGSKNLKGLVVKGNLPLELAQPQEFFSYNLEINKNTLYSAKSQSRIRTGTFSTLDLNQSIGIVPVKNFTVGVTDRYDEYNSDTLRQKFVDKDLACFGCPLPCGKGTRFEREGKEYLLGGPEYESLALLGTNLDMKSEDCCFLSLLCDELGLDSMSSGVIIACVLEALEKGRISPETLGFSGKWGDSSAGAYLLESIAHRRGVGNLLAEGIVKFAQEYDVQDIALSVKNLEMPAYDPRGTTGYALGIAVADRGACHRRARPLYVETQRAGLLYEYEGKSRLIKQLENERGFYHSLTICDFIPPYWGIKVKEFARFVEMATGLSFTEEDALTLGERAITQNRLFNIRCGLKKEDDTLPIRFFNETLPRGAAAGRVVDKEKFDKMLEDYYQLRGWDQEGRPLAETLESLGIEVI